jgi:hypothetical protein
VLDIVGAGYGIRTRDFELGKPFRENVSSLIMTTIFPVIIEVMILVTSL